MSTTPRLNRRQFLGRAARAGGAALAAASARTAPAMPPIPRPAGGPFKLSLAAYSYRKYLDLRASPRPMDILGFVRACADMGLGATEPTSYYFTEEEQAPERLLELRRQAHLLGLTVSGTAVGNDFCLPPGPERERQIAHVLRWIDHAALLGAATLRVFAGNVPAGATEADARGWCIECLERCCRHAAERGVFLALENHGGITASADQILAIVQAVTNPWFGVNLDTGNFHGPDPYAELARVAPYAVVVQLKTEVGPAGRGKEPADLPRILRLLREARYRGFISLEYEADEEPRDAVPRTIVALQKLIAESG